MMDLWSPFLMKFVIFRAIPSPKLEVKGSEKVKNKWKCILEVLWVLVPLLGSINVTFAPNDGPLAAIFYEIRDFQAYFGPETRGQRSKEGRK